MKDLTNRIWRLIIDISSLVRAGIAFLDYYDNKKNSSE